jgi:hypothetical protein
MKEMTVEQFERTQNDIEERNMAAGVKKYKPLNELTNDGAKEEKPLTVNFKKSITKQELADRSIGQYILKEEMAYVYKLPLNANDFHKRLSAFRTKLLKLMPGKDLKAIRGFGWKVVDAEYTEIKEKKVKKEPVKAINLQEVDEIHEYTNIIHIPELHETVLEPIIDVADRHEIKKYEILKNKIKRDPSTLESINETFRQQGFGIKFVIKDIDLVEIEPVDIANEDI